MPRWVTFNDNARIHVHRRRIHEIFRDFAGDRRSGPPGRLPHPSQRLLRRPRLGAVRADGLETDEYDGQARHCLVRNRASGEHIGCVRLILAEPNGPRPQLPFETTCAGVLDRSIIDPARIDRNRIAEVSRLSIVGSYRRRRGEESSPGTVQDADFGTPERPRFPYLLVGLYMGVFALADMHGLEKLFLLSETRLARHLNKIGITNTRIGDAVEHRGMRAPAVMDVRQVIDRLDPLLGSVYSVVRSGLEEAYCRAGLAFEHEVLG